MPSQQLRTALEVSPLGNAPFAHQYPHVAPGTKRMYKRLKRAPFGIRIQLLLAYSTAPPHDGLFATVYVAVSGLPVHSLEITQTRSALCPCHSTQCMTVSSPSLPHSVTHSLVTVQFVPWSPGAGQLPAAEKHAKQGKAAVELTCHDVSRPNIRLLDIQDCPYKRSPSFQTRT
jgi:hypothetical protein